MKWHKYSDWCWLDAEKPSKAHWSITMGVVLANGFLEKRYQVYRMPKTLIAGYFLSSRDAIAAVTKLIAEERANRKPRNVDGNDNPVR